MLPLILALLFGAIATLIYSIVAGVRGDGPPIWGLFIPALLMIPTSIVLLTGLFTLQPNEARVLILFGGYKGTVRDSGFHWANPFYSNGQHRVGVVVQMAESPVKPEAPKPNQPAPPTRPRPGTRFRCAPAR